MTLNTVQKKWIYRSLIMLIFIFAFALRVHHLSEKKYFTGDEIYSLILSNYEDIGWTKDPQAGEYTGKELKNMIFKADPSFKDAAKDIFLLWENNRDTPHTNFYYSLLRISLIGLESTDYKDFQEQCIFRAGALNLILFTISFFSFLFLLKLLIKDKTLILLGLIITFINKIDISQALNFRPYVLQGTFVIIFTAFLIWVSKKIEENEYKETWQNMFIFALPLSLMLLTGYYSFVYAFFIGISFIAFPLIRAKKLNLIAFFFAGSLLAVFYNLAFYKNFLAGFYSYRTFEFAGDSTHNNFFNIDLILDSLRALKSATMNKYTVICLLIIIVYKIKNKDSFKDLKKHIWLISGTILTSITIMLIAPYKDSRYICAYLSIIFLVYPILLSGIKNTHFKRIFSIIICLIFLFITFKAKISFKTPWRKNVSQLITEFDPSYKESELIYIYGNNKGHIYTYLNAIGINDNQKFVVCNVDILNSIYKETKWDDSYMLFSIREVGPIMIDKTIESELLQAGFEIFPNIDSSQFPKMKIAKRKAN